MDQRREGEITRDHMTEDGEQERPLSKPRIRGLDQVFGGDRSCRLEPHITPGAKGGAILASLRQISSTNTWREMPLNERELR